MFLSLMSYGENKDVMHDVIYEGNDMERKIKQSVKLLMNAKRVESARINDSAEKSKLSCAFVVIKEEKNAVELFTELFVNSKTNEAKIYGLLGLFELDKEQYYFFSKKLKESDVVLIQEGSLILDYRVSVALNKIQDGSLLHNVLYF